MDKPKRRKRIKMKWENKGHEFDKLGKDLCNELQKREGFYVFGAGMIGRQLAKILKQDNCFLGFIDNDVNKQANGIDGEKVISLDECLNENPKPWIIVGTTEKYRDEIFRQLIEKNVCHDSIILYDDFINRIWPIISVYQFKKVFVPLTQISLTERCTLKCKKCAHACYSVGSNAKDMAYEDAKKSADYFFERVDFCLEFVLIGGEPLLYKALPEIIRYIGEKYRNKMDLFTITTNGSITPDAEVLAACKKYEVAFRISNYELQVPRLKEKHKKLINVLKNADVKFFMFEPDVQWMDYGFEYVNRNGTEEELVYVFDRCRTSCREIRKNKFYFCVMARSVAENLEFNVGKEDYLDLEELGRKEYQKVFLEFMLGYSQKGYLDMCNYCNGNDAKNYPIPAAEQVI